jgi:hypothetical protein
MGKLCTCHDAKKNYLLILKTGMYNVLCLEGKRSLRGDRYWGMYNVLCIGG